MGEVDVEREVYKAPANEMCGSIRFETAINLLKRANFGVNCLRFFPGRGYRASAPAPLALFDSN
jgi:hypothetical protein